MEDEYRVVEVRVPLHLYQAIQRRLKIKYANKDTRNLIQQFLFEEHALEKRYPWLNGTYNPPKSISGLEALKTPENEEGGQSNDLDNEVVGLLDKKFKSLPPDPPPAPEPTKSPSKYRILYDRDMHTYPNLWFDTTEILITLTPEVFWQ